MPETLRGKALADREYKVQKLLISRPLFELLKVTSWIQKVLLFTQLDTSNSLVLFD